MAKGTNYFSHDYNTRNDEKIKKLIYRHGFEGYGIYWAVIEELYQNNNVLRIEYERIAYELRIDLQLLKSVINDFELFVFDGENFGSLSVQKRLDERAEKSKKARESVGFRWNDTNVIRTYPKRNTIKEKKVKEKKDIVIPEKTEFVNFGITESNESLRYSIEAKYTAWLEAGWKDGNGKQIVNWKTKLQNTIPHLKPFQKQSDEVIRLGGRELK